VGIEEVIQYEKKRRGIMRIISKHCKLVNEIKTKT
jgi:hypothetical protein